MSKGGKDSPRGDSDIPKRDEAAPMAPTRKEVHAFVALKATRAWVKRRVASRVKRRDTDEVADEAIERCLKSAGSAKDASALRAWVQTITDRTIADHLDKLRVRADHEGPMPVAPVARDEAGEPIPEGDPEATFEADLNAVDIDASVDPRVHDKHAEGLWFLHFLRAEVKGNPADEQTLEWMVTWAEGDKSYDDIARENNLRPGTVYQRVHAFKEKYVPRWEKHRNRTVFVLLLGAAVLALVAWWLWPTAAPKVEPIAPEPIVVPSASASATPLPPEDDGIFRPALPTQPDKP
jgi:DNA-directed RNA polymerase specialized sigma24 family protein